MSALLERALTALFSPYTLTAIGSAAGTAFAAYLWKRWRRGTVRMEDDRREHNRLGDE